MDLEQVFSNRNLSQPTLNRYITQLKKLNDNKPIKNINFLKDVEKINNKISSFKEKTQLSYYITINSFLTSYSSMNKKNISELQNKYKILMDELNKKVKDSSTATPEEIDNWLSVDAIKSKFNELEQRIALFKNKVTLNEQQYNDLLNLVILSLYTLIDPRRIKDYTDMYLTSTQSNTDDKGKNYFVIQEKKFVFNSYKTSKTYGKFVVSIPQKLYDILIKYIKVTLKKFEGRPLKLLYTFDGRPIIGNMVTRRLNSIFGKNVSVNLLRKIYATEKFGDIINMMNDTAKNMGTSTETLKLNYIKKLKLD